MLNVQCFLLAAEEPVSERVFGLDAQLLMDTLIVACAVLFLFFLLSYLVFNPARDLLRKRQEKVQADIADAERDKIDALEFKKEYEARLLDASKEADAIISDGRKRADKHRDEIVNEAKEEAMRIRERADKEIELEKNRARDEVKHEMIDVAEAIAGKFISEKMDKEKQAALVDEVISEMGESTWQ